ncbi:MAG: hypothetical protein M1837_004173 [Sclerophora amabilis]|nr:MAG: hypothetical protein M1837_004173 [Sclerophora amabilis]
MPEGSQQLFKRSRAKKPKVKTGCITCKIRRVKCDEQKPACERCLSTGRRCDGYATRNGDGKGSDDNSDEVVHQNWPYITAPLSGSAPSVIPAAGAQEHHSLQFFLCRTLLELWGQSKPEGWVQTLLQASHSESAVRHAVVALASLHEKIQSADMRTNTDHNIDKDGFALRSYNKSIRHLQKALSTCGPQSTEIALMACVMFICFEVILGNNATAASHLKSGLNILCLRHGDRRLALSHFHHRDNSFEQLFARLDIQASSFSGELSPQIELCPERELSSILRIPDSFSTLDQARDFFCSLMGWAYDYLRSTAGHFKYRPIDLIPSMVIAERNDLEDQLHQWATTFSKFIKDTGNEMQAKSLRGSILLKTLSKTMFIMMSTCLQADETAYDRQDALFAEITSLAESLVDVSETRGRKISFSTELGIIQPLYFTATKCRDPSTRRQAMALLSKSTCREGVWDGLAMGKIAEHVVAVEEADLEVRESGDVPERNRVHGVAIILDRQHRQVHVECSQRPDGPDGDWRFREDWVSW